MMKYWKIAGSSGMVSEMMKECDGFSTRWMTDLIKNIVKNAVFLMFGESASWYLCTRGKVIHLCVVHTQPFGYWSSR